jgi:hypothetical protein
MAEGAMMGGGIANKIRRGDTAQGTMPKFFGHLVEDSELKEGKAKKKKRRDGMLKRKRL